MALKHITPEEIAQYGVAAAPDRLTGKPEQNKSVFDRLVRELVAVAVNNVIDTANELLLAEDERDQGELQRETQETGRITAEVLRAAAENARANAENARIADEEARKSAETGRVNVESARVSAETARVNAEAARAAAEALRVAAETARAEAENARKTAETGRVNAENSRVTTEGARATADTERSNAEAARKTSESARVTAENGRVNAENARVTAEAGRAAEEERRINAEQARADENTGIVAQATVQAQHAGNAASTALAAAENAAASVGESRAEANRAEEAANRAETIVGGDFPTKSEAQGYVSAHNTDAQAHSALFEAPLKDTSAKAYPVDNDGIVLVDNADSKTKRVLWSSIKTTLKTWLDTLYATVSHTHAWSAITGKPTSFAPSAHNHAPADLTSAVPISLGGTGATTAAAARAALAALAAFPPTSITISATWSGTGPWTQTIAVAGVFAAWDWRLGLHLAKITDDAARKLQEKAFACITWCETYDGGITLTCRDKKPDVAISAVLAGEV